MTISPLTRPSVTQGKELDDLRDAVKDRERKPKYAQSLEYYQDNRFSTFLAWCGVILAGLMTTAICWMANSMVTVQKDIAVLLARPLGVSKEEFDRDATRWDQDINELKRETRERHGP